VTNILDGYEPEDKFAADNGVSQRTIWRYRNAGMPYLIWRGQVYIQVSGAREWLASQVKRRNQRRNRSPVAA
jgi:hypothetical protein